MIILDVNKVTKNFGYGTLFENVSFSLNEGESISIVGPNGCGKSTLLKIITGLERVDSGSISIKKGAKVAYLDQTSSDKIDDRIVIDILKETFAQLNEMLSKIKEYENLLQNNSDTVLIEKYCKLLDEFSNLGGYDMDVSINTVCSGLKISEKILNSVYSNLSGGEKTLVQLAKTLLIKPDLILLDEPTNHLDIERIEWLETYIKKFKGASVIVSHDRYFLDKMSNKILDLSDTEVKVYNTNYSGYLEEKEKDFEKQLARYEDQQIVIKRLQEQIKYFSEMGMAKNSSTLCDRAHALQTRLNKILEKKIERPKEIKQLEVKFNENKKSSKKIIEIENLTIKTKEKTILDDINLVITMKEKIAFIGSNGSGKSTLVKTIMNEQDLHVTGEIIIGPSVKIGYLPQIINFEKDNQNLITYFKECACLDEQKSRATLAAFHFYKDDVNKLVKNLSGGERIRLKLALLLQKQVNCLIFDEPTNHIDIQTKEVLEKAISEFNGTIIFVSHDRYFINKFAEKTIEFENGKITIYNGNYEYYKENKKR